MTSRESVIIWEWETNEGIFVPYDEKASNLIEQSKASSRDHVSLSQLGNAFSAWTIDLKTMEQTSSYFGFKRKIRRLIYSDNVPVAKNIAWEWMADSGWQHYDVTTACELEKCFNNGTAICNLLHMPIGLPNTVCFFTMTQTNQIYGTVRNIRRRLMSKSFTKYNAEVQEGGNERKNARDAPSSRRAAKDLSVQGYINRDKETSTAVNKDDHSVKENPQEEIQSPRGEMSRNNQVKPSKIFTITKVPITHPVLQKHCRSCDSVDDDEQCSICQDELRKPSSTFGAAGGPIVKLNKCGHKFHESCLSQYYDSGSRSGSIQCPICKTIHGVKQGNQPLGHMTVQRIAGSIPGYPGHGCIKITYNIQPGIQGREHPNPGSPFRAGNFPRVAFLPDNTKGKKVLQLLETAWDRKLIFTIGTSVTTGTKDAVVWNDIHHKTEAFSNNSGYGYPDPNYLDNVLQELEVQGVF